MRFHDWPLKEGLALKCQSIRLGPVQLAALTFAGHTVPRQAFSKAVCCPIDHRLTTCLFQSTSPLTTSTGTGPVSSASGHQSDPTS